MPQYPTFKCQAKGSDDHLMITCFQQPFKNDKYSREGSDPMIELHHLHHGKTTSTISLHIGQVEELIRILTRWYYTETLPEYNLEH